MKLTPNNKASKRTKERLKHHGPDFIIVRSDTTTEWWESPSILVESLSTSWLGWLPTDELNRECEYCGQSCGPDDGCDEWQAGGFNEGN